jgi:hypothetical protein
MADKLYIPGKIKVGFRDRDGTYTGKLAYVIYYDHKGILRKEKSWESWRDEKIAPVEFSNEPTEGFVLNKGVGGVRHSWGWNVRNEYIRVYDPRDFEFEISVANLLFILRECNCNKGKGLDGKFVYAWDGTELVLLPECSEDYKNSAKFTALQSQKVKARELKPGATYLTKDQTKLIYIGKFPKYTPTCTNWEGWKKRKRDPAYCEKYVFINEKDSWVFMDNMTKLASCQNEAQVPNYAELVDRYNKSIHGSKIVKLFLKKKIIGEKNNSYVYGARYWAFEAEPGIFYQCVTNYEYGSNIIREINIPYQMQIKDGEFDCVQINKIAYPDQKILEASRRCWRGYGHDMRDVYSTSLQPTNDRLMVQLESGSVYQVGECELLASLKEEEEEEVEDGQEV